MSELREELRAKINDAYYNARNERRTMDQASHDATDAVLRVLAEHGDTQQVREQVESLPGTMITVDQVMAIVAPILAERDAAIEWAERVEADRKKRVAALKADLAAARTEVDEVNQQLDQVRMIVLDPEFPNIKPDGPVMTMLRRILDAKGRT
jgi:hypothetical protein